METTEGTPVPSVHRVADVIVRGGPRYEFELRTPKARAWVDEHAPDIVVIDGIACAGAMRAMHMAMWMALDGLWVL